MKKFVCIGLAFTLAMVLAACGGTASAPADAGGAPSGAAQPAAGADTGAGEGEIIVFAAASMTETLEVIKAEYETAHPGISIVYNFDSSGTLKTQIEEGAACDVFISAGQKQMDQLEELGLVDPAGRLDILENKVTLCVPEGNPKAITGFDDLAARLQAGDILFCMGNSDVPVGQYTQQIFAYYGLDEAALAAAGVITYASNVKEVTTQVRQASVDCGVVYCTDAFSDALTVVDEATADMCGRILYPAAVLNGAPNAAAAQAFLNDLTTDAAMAVFQRVGFVPAA